VKTTTNRQLACLLRAGLAAAACAVVIAGCGQKGPLTLPGDDEETIELPTGNETSDDEEQDEG